MASFSCCCGGGSCCGSECSRVIDRIEVDIQEGTGAVNTYTLSVGDTIQNKGCYIPFFIGQACKSVVIEPGAVSPFYSFGFLKTISLTITQTGALPIDAFDFPCARPKVKSQLQFTDSGTSKTYYWPSEVFTEGSVFGVSGATYKGTFIGIGDSSMPNNWSGDYSPDSDATLSATIKSQLVSFLYPTYPEFASSNFDVTFARANMASCGASLGIGNQTYSRTAACLGGNGYTYTNSRSKHGFILELEPTRMTGTLFGVEDRGIGNCTYLTNPPANSTSFPSFQGEAFLQTVTAGTCWGSSYSFTLNLPTFGYAGSCTCSGGETTVTQTSPMAINVYVTVRVIYV